MKNIAVNVGQRNVPQTQANMMLDACTKALDLAIHTVKICSNDKVFPKNFNLDIANKCSSLAVDIYTTVYAANNIYISKDNIRRWPEREELQHKALILCDELISLINIAKRLYKIKSRKYEYWATITIDTRAKIKAWHDANAKMCRDIAKAHKTNKMLSEKIDQIDIMVNAYINDSKSEDDKSNRREVIKTITSAYVEDCDYRKIDNIMLATKLWDEIQQLIINQ